MVFPSPKSHVLVEISPVEPSVNDTDSGASPSDILATMLATGGEEGAGSVDTETRVLDLFSPPGPLTVSVTV